MYTCFLHPRAEHGEQKLADVCPEPGCGRPYSWPLDRPPRTIGPYEVLRPLGRGFYAATYLVKRGRLGVPSVLKVTPAAFYKSGLKRTDFLEESLEHKRVAEGTTHLAQIRDIFGDDEGGFAVDFDGVTILCYVAVLDYVKGRPLGDYLTGESMVSARGAAQIAIDLLALLAELERKGVQHNDLHETNVLIEELPEDARRAQAVDETIRAVAIDFGSLAETSSSQPEIERLGDLHQVARHLGALSIRLLRDPSTAEDDDYRLASALDQLAGQMRPARVNQRQVNFEDQIQLIRDTVFLTDSPWRDPGALPRFGEAYNAATLKSWYVPKLLVDPGEDWRKRISTSGPQLITGMRGCGKTMLLRALEVHGRAVQSLEGGDVEGLSERLGKDHWVGLYESATRLLDTLGAEATTDAGRPLHEPHARLLVAYAREAIQALRHLSYLDPGLAVPGYAGVIGKAVAAHLRGAEDLADCDSELELERTLQRYLIDLSDHRPGLQLATNPAVAFPGLADAIRRSSSIWHDAAVYFLLDDVSTRNLDAENIRGLWSSLLFKDESCAFKMTTEAQTIEQLRSPGLIETAQIGRDVDVFYLDEEVNVRTKQRGPDGGRSFIGSILGQRAKIVQNHPSAHPEQVLGGGTLEAIAREIAGAANSSDTDTSEVRTRLQGVYHGLNALSAVCVGDIGDVIAIYETMLRAAGPNPTLPLSPQLQSSAFQQYSRRRLYHLNRRGDDLRSFAATFAKAAHELLRDSMRKGSGKRLRQYSAIHIQIDRERQSTEYEKILKLVDAGVFVFDPGQKPRLRRGGADPTASFILNYRKLFGLFSYIGLAERDRFELKGEAISEWLANPEDHTILTRRLGVPFIDGSAIPAPESDFLGAADRLFDDELFEASPARSLEVPTTIGLGELDGAANEEKKRFLDERVPGAQRVTVASLSANFVGTLVLGLGFEERTLASARRLLEACRPTKVLAVRYPEPGHEAEILKLVRAKGIPLTIVDHSSASEGPKPSGPLLVDSTGLTKALIFALIRDGIESSSRVWVAHTRAEQHWPLNSDIEPLLAQFGDDYYGLLEAMERLNSGDLGKYQFVKLMPSDGDQSRARVLCTASTARHERLLSFIERREYDDIQIAVPASESPRGKIGLIAAEIAGQQAYATQLVRIPADDLSLQLRNLGEQYHYWYHRGREVELALTGSKMHAAACAAIAGGLKLGQCWYVRPEKFDTPRFSRGVGETDAFEITAAPVS